jgi:pSer/pThr/pTyr-binding forkhead associated (FHA) protein
MSEIYGLHYDYSNHNGQSIVFTERNGKSITSGDLNEVQLKMIQSNSIPHLLSLSVENMDLKTKLFYDLTSKSKLTSYFQKKNATMNDYYQVFLSIISTLESCSSYMLDQEKFILKQDFIYIGKNPGDIYIAYLPVKKLDKETNVTEDMKKLLTDVAGEVEGLQGNEFKSILNYIKNDGFSVGGLKKLLLELISLRSNVNHSSQVSGFSNEAGIGESGGKSFATSQQLLKNNGSEPDKVQDEQSTVTQTQFKTKKKLPKLTSREKVYIFSGTLLSLALIWKLYDAVTTQAMLGVSSGLSIIIVVAVVTYIKWWRPGVQPIETEVPVQVKEQKGNSKQVQPETVNKQSQSQPKPYSQQTAVSFQQQAHSQQPAYASQQLAAATAMDTTLLTNPSDDTVLLEDEANLSTTSTAPSNVTAILSKTSPDGQEETIELNRNNFLIGRNADAVSYAEEATGVSRLHAEIIQIDSTSYGIKDLGSKNGSKLNGNTMVPYKVYALQEDDEIMLGKATYIFKWSHSS